MPRDEVHAYSRAASDGDGAMPMRSKRGARIGLGTYNRPQADCGTTWDTLSTGTRLPTPRTAPRTRTLATRGREFEAARSAQSSAR